MLRSEKMILRRTGEIGQWLSDATAIYNQALYYLRQELFASVRESRKPDYSSIDLYKLVKETDSWKSSDLDVNAKQYVLRNVRDNWTSFLRACRSYWKDRSRFHGMPKAPRYLKNGRTAVLTFDKSRLRNRDVVNNTLTLPKSAWTIRFPEYLKISSIRCITVRSYYGKVKLCIGYDREAAGSASLDPGRHMGMDIGVDNIVAMTTDNHVGKSWIVKGGAVKSINQFYNKRLAELKSSLERVNGRKTSRRVQRLAMKRENRLSHELHCISRAVVRLCVENGIGSLSIGHNDGWKQNADMGRTNNQNFVQIPFDRLVRMVQYKAEEAGVSVTVTEESYTSKTDHLAGEAMCRHDEYLGRRVSRGLFVSSCGKRLNADINGAIGILRKTNALPDADLVGLRDRGDVVSPSVLRYKP